MSSTKQKTGGSATPGPGLKGPGTGSSVSHRKPASLGKTGNVSPNSSNRGKQG